MAQEYVPGTIPPAVSFETVKVTPPSQLYVGREDRLIMRSWDATAVAGCSLRGRVMLPGGFVQVFNYDHGFDGTRALRQQFLPIPEGFLLSLIVETPALAVRRGQAFVEVGLVRGQAAQSFRTAKLISGYVSDITPLAWPGDTLEDSLDGRGMIRSITGTNPAAGVEISETVPTNARWRLIAARMVLVTGVAAANRIPYVVLDDGATKYFEVVRSEAITASQTRTITLHGVGTTAALMDVLRMYSLPEMPILLAGHRLRTETTALQAGDDWGAPQLLVEEWIEE